MFKISLSPGHSLVTPGKRTPDGMHEWEFNSSVVSKMIELFSHYKDTAVLRLDDPTGNRDIPLQERAKRSNDWGANYHLDVHANAFGIGWNDAHGIETFSYKLSGESFNIGSKLQAALIAATGLTNRGVKDASENGAGYYMICKTKAPANLCECGFMTNPAEAMLLKSDVYRSTVANALVGAIAGNFNLVKSAPVVANPAPQPVPAAQPTPVPIQQPTPAKKRYVVLPANEPTWTVYKLDRPCVKSNPANIAGTLKPSKFSGLEYEILKDRGNWVFEIQTSNFGRVQIFADPDQTSARVVTK